MSFSIEFFQYVHFASPVSLCYSANLPYTDLPIQFPNTNFNFAHLSEHSVLQFLPCEAMLSAVYAVVVCLSVCHTPVLYQNGQT